MKPKTRNLVIGVFKYLVSVAILGYLFHHARKEGQWAAFVEAEKQWWWLAVAAVAVLSACLISCYRWWLLVKALDLPLRLIDAVQLGFIGYAFSLASFGVLGGDAVKSIYVGRRVRHRIPEAIATVFVDRAVGLYTMFAVASVAYWTLDWSALNPENPEMFRLVQSVCRLTTITTVIGLAVIVFLFLTPRFRKTPIYRWMAGLPKIGSLMARLVEVIVIYRRRTSVLLKAFGLSLVINLLFVSAIFSVAQGIAPKRPTFAQHLVISPIAMVANAVPLPMGIGGMEYAMDQLYRGFSQADDPGRNGFVVALGYRLFWLLVAVIGVVCYLTHRREIREITETDRRSEPV